MRWRADRERLPGLVRRVARSRVLWSAAALLLLYALGGFFLAPYLVERYVPRFAEQKLKMRATIAAVRINPFLFKFEASGFKLEGNGERPQLGLGRFYVDFELWSIFHRAWTFADVQLEGADLALEIDSDGRLNLAELIERLRDPDEPPGPTPRMILDRVIVTDASIGLLDLSRGRATAKFLPVNLELTGVSTLRESTGHYTLTATLPAGGSLAWKGSVSLEPLASNGEFSVRGLQLATAWRFLRDELNVSEPRGALALAGRYDAAYDKGTSTATVEGFQAELSGLSLALTGGASPLVALETIRIDEARFSLTNRELVVPKLGLSTGNIAASVAKDGTLDWQRLGKSAGSEQAPDEARTAQPGVQPWRVRLEKVGVEKVALAYTDASRTPELTVRAAELSGGFKLDVTIGAGPARIVAEDIHVALNGTSVLAPASDAPPATLDAFTLTGGRVDVAERSVLAKAAALSGGGVKIERGPEGPMGLLRAFAPAKRAAPAVSKASRKKPVPDNAWRYRLDSVELTRFRVGFSDRAVKPAIQYETDVVSAALRNIDSAGTKPIDFTSVLKNGARGTLKGSGTLLQDFSQARAKVEAADIALDPLKPFVTRYTVLDLKSGHLAASTEIAYRAEGRPSLTARGAVWVHDLLLNETATGERFVAWKTLFADDIAFSLAPDKLVVKTLRVVGPGMKMVIAQDRTINLTKVMKKEASPAESGAGDPFPYEIGRVALEGGTLDFADLGLVLPFATRVHGVGGSITGISSDPKSRAELKIRGEVEPYGEARAEGSLIPARPTSFLDIEARFDNIQIPPLSPYSATFAGRKIASGKLWLTLHYKIVNEQLAGENKIVLEDFSLGERVASPTAMDLPLDLAIALLKESDGKIRLAVPVTGDVGNPKFDYGSVIRGAISNVLTSLVTAPFRLLAGLLGGGKGEEIRSVEFAPGSDRIAPAQRENLDGLAQALKQRTALKLVVRGPYDAKRDGERLRRDGARRDLALKAGEKLKAGEDPGPIPYGSADTQTAMEKLLADRAGSSAVREFAGQYAKRTGREPERVNPVLGFVGRGSRDVAFYEALFERLVELQPLPDEAPKLLAERRAQAIVDTVGKAGLGANRVQAGSIRPVTMTSGSGVSVELALEAMPGGS